MKVSIFGHSYVRDLQRLGHESATINDVTATLKYYSFPGSGFKDFLSNGDLLNGLVQGKPDIVVVVLGGNDIKVDVDISNVKHDCERFYKLLREKLPNTFVIASQVEFRQLSVVNRHGTPKADLFKKLAISFNKWLCRQTFKDKILLVNGCNKLGDKSFFREDLVHLNLKGLKLLFSLIISCIANTHCFSK